LDWMRLKQHVNEDSLEDDSSERMSVLLGIEDQMDTPSVENGLDWSQLRQMLDTELHPYLLEESVSENATPLLSNSEYGFAPCNNGCSGRSEYV